MSSYERTCSATSKPSSYGLELVFRNILIAFLPEGMSGNNLPVAFDRQACPVPFRPDSAFDGLIGNPVIMSIIGHSRRLEDPSRLLMSTMKQKEDASKNDLTNAVGF